MECTGNGRGVLEDTVRCTDGQSVRQEPGGVRFRWIEIWERKAGQASLPSEEQS